MKNTIAYGHRAWHRGPSIEARRWAEKYATPWHRRNSGRRIAEAFAMARGARAQVREVSA